MVGRLLLWVVPAFVYLLFTSWYTSFGGPVTEEEIDGYLAAFAAAGRPPESTAVLRGFLEKDDGRQFLMLNLIDLNEQPEPQPDTSLPVTAQAYIGHYMEHMYPALFARASHPIFAGLAQHQSMDIVGIEGAEHWEQAALMRYRSRRDLADIVTNPAFSERHDYKVAALEKTIAFPVGPILYMSDPRFLLALMLLALTAVLDILLFNRPGKASR